MSGLPAPCWECAAGCARLEIQSLQIHHKLARIKNVSSFFFLRLRLRLRLRLLLDLVKIVRLRFLRGVLTAEGAPPGA